MSTGIGIGVSSVFIQRRGSVTPPPPINLILLEDGVFFITLEDNSGLVALEN
jgi:hypothetical protein|tara:strand:+ start:174 stop:329 length:156 start_codon:yes stop_codon:yes gene_type:complete